MTSEERIEDDARRDQISADYGRAMQAYYRVPPRGWQYAELFKLSTFEMGVKVTKLWEEVTKRGNSQRRVLARNPRNWGDIGV